MANEKDLLKADENLNDEGLGGENTGDENANDKGLGDFDEKPLEEYSLVDLQKMASDLGMVGVEVFTTKKQVIAVINKLKDMASKPATHVDDIAGVNKGGTVVPTVLPDNNDKSELRSYQAKAKRMKAKLDAQPRVRFYVPLQQGEKKGAIEHVQMNGYPIHIMKGVSVMIPQQVADFLEERYDMVARAGDDYSVDRTDPETGKKISDILTY